MVEEAEDVTKYTKEELILHGAEEVKQHNSKMENEINSQHHENINREISELKESTPTLNDINNIQSQVHDSNDLNQVPKTYLNPDYFDEFGRPKYEAVVDYENQLREIVEKSSPLVSDKYDINYLKTEFKESQFENSVNEICHKYKSIRTVRRDGNCFYRAFMFRLFEQLSTYKTPKLYNDVVKIVEESKLLCEKNGYQWLVLEDFYNMFISEWKFVYQLDPLNTAEYMYVTN